MSNKGLRETPRSRTSTETSRKEHDRIFGKKKVQAGRYVQVDGKLVPADEVERPVNTTAYVMGDIQPYKSPLDGTIINSRSSHRAHKRQHGVIEVGNEKLTRRATKNYEPQGVKQDVVQSMKELSRR